MKPTTLGSPVQAVMSIPEQLFRLGPLRYDGDTVRGTMVTGPWLRDSQSTTGAGRPGTLGVLIDDVLGYAINAVTGCWSVSTEIGLDILAPIPADGSMVHAEASVVHADETGGLAEGVVLNETGDVIARCYERGRWVEAAPPAETAAAGWVEHSESLEAADLETLLGSSVTEVGTGLSVHVVPRIVNPLGNLHGGVSLCLGEWLAASTLPEPGFTASIRSYYVRGAPLGATVNSTPSVLHAGRSYGIVQVVAGLANGKPCTITTVTRHNAA